MAFARSLLQKMLLDAQSEDDFDVQLIVEGATPKQGSETTLRAHRIVLSTASPEFRKMFQSGLRAHSEAVVRIPDFSAGAVREALSVIYGGELTTAARDWKLAGQVWDFGHRFRIEHVATMARAAALSLVSEENALRVLGFALYAGDDAAAEQLREYIAEPAHFLRVVRSAEFSLASYEVVAGMRRPGAGTFVEQDILTFEKVWFDALVNWAAAGSSPPADADGAKKADAERRRIARLTQAMRLVDFGRMRTHELREAHRCEAAAGGNVLAGMLVGVLLARAEKLEALNFEKERDIEELGAQYQMAMYGKSEADRNVRLTAERLEKVSAGKLSLDEEDKRLRRTSGAGVHSNGGNGGEGSTYPYMPHRRKRSSGNNNSTRSPIL